MDTIWWLSIAFVIVGVLLIFLEIFNPGFFIAIIGAPLFIGGVLGLIAPDFMYGSYGWLTWIVSLILATLFTLWAYKKWAPPGNQPLTLSIDSLPGTLGKVTRDVNPDDFTGKVRIRGSNWSAQGTTTIAAGTKVRVVSAEGVHVVVEPAP